MNDAKDKLDLAERVDWDLTMERAARLIKDPNNLKTVEQGMKSMSMTLDIVSTLDPEKPKQREAGRAALKVLEIDIRKIEGIIPEALRKKLDAYIDNCRQRFEGE